MRTKILSIAAVLLALFCGSAKADNVDLMTAKQIGAYYFTVATGAKAPVSTDNMKLVQQFDNPTLCVPAMYAFNVADNGFVVVSACDATEPILAYAPEGSIAPEDINPSCKWLLDSYAKLICQNQNYEAKASAQAKAMWNELYAETKTVDLTKAGVLVQTKWDQGENYGPTYNAFSPKLNGKYCYAGCVAVAMAQIIKYWNYPVVGGNSDSSFYSYSWTTGNTTLRYKFAVDSNKFVYDSMPNKLTTNSEWNHIRAIAKLMYACAVTVDMDFSPEGSGAQSWKVKRAFWRWFRYSPEVAYKTHDGVNDALWVEMLTDEITTHQRPVYYSGYDNTSGGRDAGHAWVVCGQSAADNTKFYINWGWGGSSNGFFCLAPITSIGAAGGYTFSSGHAMVCKIFPDNLSIDENTAFATSPAYPNPATDYMMIPVDLPNSATLGVFSIDGKMLENLVVPAGAKEYRLNLQHYAPGTYVYRLNGQAYKFNVL